MARRPKKKSEQKGVVLSVRLSDEDHDRVLRLCGDDTKKGTVAKKALLLGLDALEHKSAGVVDEESRRALVKEVLEAVKPLLKGEVEEVLKDYEEADE